MHCYFIILIKILIPHFVCRNKHHVKSTEPSLSHTYTNLIKALKKMPDLQLGTEILKRASCPVSHRICRCGGWSVAWHASSAWMSYRLDMQNAGYEGMWVRGSGPLSTSRSILYLTECWERRWRCCCTQQGKAQFTTSCRGVDAARVAEHHHRVRSSRPQLLGLSSQSETMAARIWIVCVWFPSWAPTILQPAETATSKCRWKAWRAHSLTALLGWNGNAIQSRQGS